MDPDALFRAALLDAGADALLGRLEPSLGRQLYGWILGKLHRESYIHNARTEADGVFQDFLLRIVRRFGNRDNRPVQSAGWFRTVAQSALLDRLGQSARTHHQIELALMGHHPIEESSLDTVYANQLVNRALEKLSPREREMILLDQDGLSTRQISKAMGIRENSVVTLRHKATTMLKERLQAEMLRFR